MFFPIVNRILRWIGLPWLSSLERYSELWRMELDQWVEKQYKKRGFDPVGAKTASEALAEELQKTTDAEVREAWEWLVALLSKLRGEQGSDAG
jgi:nitric oxide synthase oxygenase domain/subunit